MTPLALEAAGSGFWTALLSIIVIDLVLAGDNAIVIGMAARNLPANQQNRVILWGTAGAILVRIIATFLVVWLLKIPGLLLIGGLLLIYIAIKLLTQKKDHSQIAAAAGFGAAVRTIVIADAVMGLDNVLAIAGAAHGSYLLIVLGLLVSVPIVVWGSKLIIGWIERFPAILYVGAAVLVFTAGKMIAGERWFAPYLQQHLWIKWLGIAVLIGLVLAYGWQRNRMRIAEHQI